MQESLLCVDLEYKATASLSPNAAAIVHEELHKTEEAAFQV